MYKSLLLPVDLDQEASWTRSLPAAVELCGAFGAALHVLTVIPGFTMTWVEQYFPADSHAKLVTETTARLDGFLRDHVPAEIGARPVVAEGRIYERILATADRTGADLIVMASHSPDLEDFLLGPNAARVVRHAPISVLVVR